MKTIMIWDNTVAGHHLEFLHHIYDAAIYRDARFVFVLPREFEEKRYLMIWPESDNILFDIMSRDEVAAYDAGYLMSAFRISMCLRKYALKHNVDDILLITLCQPYPLLPFILPKKTRVSGIIYQIYFYRWKQYSLFVKIKYVIETWSMAHFSSTKHPLVLNDTSAAHYFNKMYHTDKYLPLVDPVVVSNMAVKCDRSRYCISEESLVFFHFGAMGIRKGTLDLLQAINLLSSNQLKGKTFLFAGKIDEGIKDEFCRLYDKARTKGANIIVHNGFCDYALLDELCALCDYVVVPYRYVELSSGVAGHSAVFGKRLIGPAEGIIGKLIKQCPGSVAIPQLSPAKIADAITKCTKYQSCPNDAYLNKNSVANFQHQVMGALMD